MLSNLLVQLVNGLADASTLFLVAAGLSLIFGVTRIVNFAHGSFYMFGIYVAYSIASRFGHTAGGFWLSVLAAALAVAVLGALVEIVVLRRIYQAPELFHLLATFALVLIFRDAALWLWGPDDLFGPRAPHLAGAVDFLGHPLPTYDIALIVIGPVVLLLLWYALTRTRWGTLVRAATQDREMLGALGINQAWLFTGVFFVGAFLAGLGGALQGPRMRIVCDDTPPIVRAAWLRGVSALPNTFAHESFIDELAEQAGVDPVEFRLRHLTDPRAIDLVKAVAAKAGWEPREPAFKTRGEDDDNIARGRGIAYARYVHSKFPGFGAA